MIYKVLQQLPSKKYLPVQISNNRNTRTTFKFKQIPPGISIVDSEQVNTGLIPIFPFFRVKYTELYKIGGPRQEFALYIFFIHTKIK